MAFVIGGYNFYRGESSALEWMRDAAKRIEREGADGVAYRAIARKARTFSVRTACDYSSAADAKTAMSLHAALIHTLVSITDHTGTTYTNIYVVDTRPVGFPANVLTPSGGINGGAWVLEEEWTLQATLATT